MQDVILVHHGVKGQKWGVRNGPPYPIEHPVMRKGTKLATVVGGATPYSAMRSIMNRKTWTYTYNPNDKWDSKVYEGPFTAFLAMGRGQRYIAKHSLEVVRDLKMPSKAQRIQEFKDLYNSKRFNKRVIKEMKATQQMLKAHNIGSKEALHVDLDNLKSSSDFTAAYEVFNHAMEQAHSYKSTKEYMKRISSKYDAMVDDNNQGIYNEAHDPVIIFRIQDVMYQRGDTPVRLVTGQEMSKNYIDVAEELKKRGKHVLL